MAVRGRCVSGQRGIMDAGWPGIICGGLLGARVSRAESDSAVDGRHGRRGGGECACSGCARPRRTLLRPELRAQQLNLRWRFGTDRLAGDGPHPRPQADVAIQQWGQSHPAPSGITLRLFIYRFNSKRISPGVKKASADQGRLQSYALPTREVV